MQINTLPAQGGIDHWSRGSSAAHDVAPAEGEQAALHLARSLLQRAAAGPGPGAHAQLVQRAHVGGDEQRAALCLLRELRTAES